MIQRRYRSPPAARVARVVTYPNVVTLQMKALRPLLVSSFWTLTSASSATPTGPRFTCTGRGKHGSSTLPRRDPGLELGAEVACFAWISCEIPMPKSTVSSHLRSDGAPAMERPGDARAVVSGRYVVGKRAKATTVAFRRRRKRIYPSRMRASARANRDDSIDASRERGRSGRLNMMCTRELAASLDGAVSRRRATNESRKDIFAASNDEGEKSESAFRGGMDFRRTELADFLALVRDGHADRFGVNVKRYRVGAREGVERAFDDEARAEGIEDVETPSRF